MLQEKSRASAPPAGPAPAEPQVQAEAPTLPTTPTPAPTLTAAAPAPAPARRGRGSRARRAVTHGAALILGLLLGVGGTLALTGPRVPLGYPTDPTGCPSGVAPASPGSYVPQGADVPQASTGTPGPSWIARPASEAARLDGTEVVLPFIREVSAGDTLVVTVMLTSTCAGEVHAKDSQGNTYRIAGDVTDASRHRTLVLVAFDVRPLGTADQITLSYPHSSKYHVAVDEFRGIHAVAGHAEGYGPFGGTAFSTSRHPLTCRSGDLMVGAVGTNTGTAPQFVAGWTDLPVLELSSYKLTTAYRVASDEARCAATGTTTAQWGAVLVTFR
ncbi:hypothetical protein ABIA32_000540 [Streptacidiphilus sp. MAP12-20]|uniref:hypothetical protein n=1 Tax=Streptacidiphilus sp. MAP12-20 TaxID=3156299 RepID=UPI0035144126